MDIRGEGDADDGALHGPFDKILARLEMAAQDATAVADAHLLRRGGNLPAVPRVSELAQLNISGKWPESEIALRGCR